jgi:hypothetical protein
MERLLKAKEETIMFLNRENQMLLTANKMVGTFFLKKVYWRPKLSKLNC